MAQTLSDLLSEGALESVVQWIMVGRNENEIRGFLRQDFPDAYSGSIKAVMARGYDAVAAGAAMELGGSEFTAPLKGIPTNPTPRDRIYGIEGRFTYRVSVYTLDSAGNERAVTVFVSSDTLLSSEEVRQEAQQIADAENESRSWIDSDPFDRVDADRTPAIISVQRRY